MKTIGLVIAIEKELTSFLESRRVKVKTTNVNGFDVYSFCLSKKKVVCVHSTCGEILSSSATQLLISKYKVDYIFNFGICGSLSKDFGVLDTVLCGGVVHYDMDTSAIDPVEKGRYWFLPSTVIPTDENLRKLAKEINPNLKEVICASGDKFICDENIKANLRSSFNAEICEMESAGIALTSYVAKVPCFIVKAVSDGQGGADDFNKFAKRASTMYLELIDKMIERL